MHKGFTLLYASQLMYKREKEKIENVKVIRHDLYLIMEHEIKIMVILQMTYVCIYLA